MTPTPTPTTPFIPSLISAEALERVKRGCASGELNPSKLSRSLGPITGPWLACYMIRRFGWPNINSDDYKNLCSWMLTTPEPGLYLTVTPYMGAHGQEDSTNLHFGYAWEDSFEAELHDDPGRKSFFDRLEKFMLEWWEAEGQQLFTYGQGSKNDKDEELVHGVWSLKDEPDQIVGFYRRKEGHPVFTPPEGDDQRQAWKEILVMFAMWSKVKPEGLPTMTQEERDMPRPRNKARFDEALLTTIRSFLHPTNVRDISFTMFGDIERTEAAIERYSDQPSAGYYEHAGYCPRVLFTKILLPAS